MHALPSPAAALLLGTLSSLAAFVSWPVAPAQAAAGGDGVVHVAPPTGNNAADRASIISALEEVDAGGTVAFAAETM